MKKFVWFLFGIASFFHFPGEANSEIDLKTSFLINADWDTGYKAEITLTNNSKIPVEGWRTEFDLGPGQTLAFLKNGNQTVKDVQSDLGKHQRVFVKNDAWNGILSPNESVSFEFEVHNPYQMARGAVNLFSKGITEKEEKQDRTPFILSPRYEISEVWENGYQALITLNNPTENFVSCWSISFKIPEEHSVTTLWNGEYTVEGQVITVKNSAWNSAIKGQDSIKLGMTVRKPANSTPYLTHIKAIANHQGSTETAG